MNPLAWLQHCGWMFSEYYGGVYLLTVLVAMFAGLIGGGILSYRLLSRFVRNVAGEEACGMVDRGLFWAILFGTAVHIVGGKRK